jgi:uncharacterized protein YrrD
MAFLRGRDLICLPIVSLGGDDIAEVRDVLFDAKRGALIGFTLNKRGPFSGRMNEMLLEKDVLAIGSHAIIVSSAASFHVPSTLDSGAPIGNVISDSVVTETGVAVGMVTDVVIDSHAGVVVGFEIAPTESGKSRERRKVYLPFDNNVSVSSDMLIVPEAAIDHIDEDFAGFGEAITRYRNALTANTVVVP